MPKENDIKTPAELPKKKQLQAALVEAVKSGNFKVSARLRLSIANIK